MFAPRRIPLRTTPLPRRLATAILRYRSKKAGHLAASPRGLSRREFKPEDSAIRNALPMVLGLVALFFLSVGLQGREDKEVTLKGTITCAKCDLKLADKCATVIKVEKDGKDVVYYFDTASHKKNHGKICQTPMPGTVKGTVSEKDGKKIIKVSQVTFGD